MVPAFSTRPAFWSAWHGTKSFTPGVNATSSPWRSTGLQKKFPDDERYGLTSQTRRAAFSAAVNIVEGSARRSPKEFRRFLDISLSSLSEVGYALRFAYEAGILTEEDWPGLSDLQSRARFLTWQLYRALGR